MPDTALTQPLRLHHRQCDALFANAEEAAQIGQWSQCQDQLGRFAEDLERHFSSEETLLFPAFEAATGMSGGPTQVMRLEHRQMRELIVQLNEAAAHQDAEGFAGAAETLLVLMQQHNLKEENILYPMCDRALSADLGDELRNHLEGTC